MYGVHDISAASTGLFAAKMAAQDARVVQGDAVPPAFVGAPQEILRRAGASQNPLNRF